MSATGTAVGPPVGGPAGRRGLSVRVLDALLEAALCGLVAAPVLFQSTRLTDNLLGKSGVTLILAGLVVMLWVAASVARQGTLVLRRSRADLPFVALLAISVVALATAQNVWRGAEVLLTQVLLFAVFVVVRHRYRARPARARLVWAILLTGLVVSLIGILQYGGVHLVAMPEGYGNLPISTLGNTNFVAHYLELILPLAAALALWARRPWWQRLILLGVLSSAGFHMLLTGSRAGWLSTGVALLLLGALSVPRRRLASKVVLVLVVGALLSPVAELAVGAIRDRDGSGGGYPLAEFVDQAWERVLSSFDERNFSRAMRVLIWRDTLRLIGAHPLLGVGPGNYEFSLPAHRGVSSHRAWRDLMGPRHNEPYFAHNEYLETWAEIGLVGLAASAWLMGVLLWVGWDAARRLWSHRQAIPETPAPETPAPETPVPEGDPDALALAFGTIAALSAALVHACFSFNLQDPVSGTHFWILAGLMMAIAGGEKEAGAFELNLKRLSSRGPRFWATGHGFGVAGGVLGGLGVYVGVCILAGDYYYSRYFQAHGVRGGVEATAQLQRAIGWRPHEFRHLHEFGRVLLAQERPRDAEYILRRSLELHPHDKGALRRMGRSLIFQRRGSEAVFFLDRAKEVDPLHAETYNLLAAAYRQGGDFGAVVEARKQALAFRPEDPAFMMSLGLAYKEAGQLEEAEAVLSRAAGLEPQSGLIQGNLGAVYHDLRRLPEAERALRAAIANDADERVTWRLNLALVFILQGRVAEAEAEVAQALEEAPESRQVRGLAA